MASKTSKKKPTFEKDTAFDLRICNAIRTHIGIRKALESKRKNAFGDRDNAIAELRELRDQHSPEALRIKERHSDAEVQIVDLSKRIKWHSNEVDALVENADEPSFEFMLEPPAEVLAPKVRKGDPMKEGEPKVGSATEKHQLSIAAEDPRPVGRPSKGKGGKGPDEAEGFNEHLAASINELDIMAHLKPMLIEAGFTTIAELAIFLDDSKNDLQKQAKIGEHYAIEIRKAVSKFRKSHRRAMLETEGAAS